MCFDKIGEGQINLAKCALNLDHLELSLINAWNLILNYGLSNIVNKNEENE